MLYIRMMQLWRAMIILALISLVVILIWFSSGQLISNNSEENLNLVNVSEVAKSYGGWWYSFYATGIPTPFYIPRYPTFVLLSWWQQIGLTPVTIQAVFLGAIIWIGMLAMYLWLKYGLKLGGGVSLVGGLFYFFNLFTMTYVFKRFLYNGMIAWAYLPLFVWLWQGWLDKGRWWWLVGWLASLLFFSYTFSHPGFVLTLSIVAAILAVGVIWQHRFNRSLLVKVLGRIGLGVVLGVLVSSWWLYPMLVLGSGWVSDNNSSPNADYESLVGVSATQKSQDILLLRQSWFFGSDTPWFSFYDSPLVYLMSLGLLVMVIIGVWRSWKKESYLIGLLVAGWFISKGSNPPLGELFFKGLFNLIPMTAVLRNPYEKFGVVFVLAYISLAMIGISYLWKMKPGWRIGLVVAIGLWMVVLVYPLWTGSLFPSQHHVSVPGYYAELNRYLETNQSERLIHIPYTANIEKVEYDWGYVGEDPMENLILGGNLSEPGLPVYRDIHRQLEKLMGQSEFPAVVGLLGGTHLVLHREMVLPSFDFNKFSQRLSQWQGISFEKEFGPLLLYRIDRSLVRPLVYALGEVKPVDSVETGLNQVATGKIKADRQAFTNQSITLTSTQPPQIQYLKKGDSKVLVNVSDASEKYLLVLNNTYHPNWQAKIGDQLLTEHLKVNGFANGWIIDRSGSYQVDLEFKIWPWP